MKLKSIIIIFCFFIISCQVKTFQYNRNDMGGTIKAGSVLKYRDKKNIEKDDIIVFEYFDKRLDSKRLQALRVVGVPGDIVSFIGGELFINDSIYKLPETSQLSYFVKIKKIQDWGILDKYSWRITGRPEFRMFFLDHKEYESIQNNATVDSIFRVRVDSNGVDKNIVTNNSFSHFNGFYYGPLKIPSLHYAIDTEIKKLIPITDKFSIGEPLSEKLYFVVGDNLHWCYDSRDIGLIPESLIKGVVILSDK